MHSRVCVAVGRLVRLFARGTDGSLVPMFAFAMVPMLGMVGAAVDYSHAGGVRAGLQAALDAAVLAGARDGTVGWSDVALSVFNANLASKGASVGTPTFTKNADGVLIGTAHADVPASFFRVRATSNITVSAQSQAVLSGSTAQQFCVLALNSSAQPAVKLT